MQSNLGKFNAKKWFTYSVLCCLAREDLVKAQKLLGEDLCHFSVMTRPRHRAGVEVNAVISTQASTRH